jgi:hypothetical protein
MIFQLVSGNAGYVTVSTYSTADNENMQPLPAGVSVVNYANMIKRFWHIDKTGVTANFTVTFTFDPSELPDNNGTGVINMQRWNSLTGSWDAALPNQVYDEVNNTVTVPGVTQFSPWGGGDTGSPLPVEMVEFTGEHTDGIVKLNWTTAIEVNNKQFDIQRSTDGLTFEKIGEVAGNNNSTITSYYEFTDASVQSGVTYYYRLNQVDYDGKNALSEVIPVTVGSLSKKEDIFANAVLYPNPNQGNTLTIDMHNTTFSEDNILVNIIDITGKICYQRTFNWTNSLVLDAQLSPGLYFVKLSTSTEQKVLQLVRTE